MNALAILYDVATAEQAPAILDRITVPGHGIDAPPELLHHHLLLRLVSDPRL